MYKCKVCNKEFDNKRSFSLHITMAHKMNSQQYYDTFFKTKTDGKCQLCEKETSWNNGTKRYNKLCRKCGYGLTLEKCIIRHGEEKGLVVWKEYCKKQSFSNSYEYKKEKHGMTLEQYKNYNKARAITKELCIKRHGEEKGLVVWNEYCEKQKTAGISLNHFQEKYGEVEGKKFYEELNKKKSHNLTNYIERYGEVMGREKYEFYCENKKVGFFSKIANELFENIDDNNDKSYYGLNEFGIMSNSGSYFKYDYVIPSTKKIIEFNGDAFHPKERTSEWKNPYDSSITSEQAFDKDIEKINLAREKGFEVMIVWESSYNNDKEYIEKQCREFLEKK